MGYDFRDAVRAISGPAELAAVPLAAPYLTGAPVAAASLLEPGLFQKPDGTVWIRDENGDEAQVVPGGSQPFTPTDLTGLMLWLDASTLTLDDDDPVALWPDSSGNDYDAAQAESDNQPVFKEAVQNGLGVVRFDAGGEFPQYLALTAGLGMLRNKPGCTIAAAARRTGGGEQVLWISSGTDGGLDRATIAIGGSDEAFFAVSNDDSVSGGSSGDNRHTGVAPDAWLTLVGAGEVAGWNGVALDASAGMPQSPAYAPLTPGNFPNTDSELIWIGDYEDSGDPSTCLTGDIGEIIVCDRALNAEERRQVFEYLSAKWATL